MQPFIFDKESESEWGMTAESDSLRFVFSGTFRTARIERERLAKSLDKLVSIVLTVVAAMGAIGLLYSIWHLGYFEDDIWFLFRHHYYNAAFWIGALAALYLWAKRIHEAAEYEVTRVLSPAVVAIWVKHGRDIDVYKLFTHSAKEVWNNSLRTSRKYGTETPNTVHIFLALLDHPAVKLVFFRFGVNPATFIPALEQYLKTQGLPNESDLVQRLPFAALEEALKMRNRSVDALMLLCALVTILPEDHVIQKIFFNVDLSYEKLEAIAAWVFNLDLLVEDDRIFRKLARHKSDSGLNKGLTAVPTPYLDQFSQDLTIAAKYHRLPLTRGRDTDLDKVIDLFGQGKNVLIKGPVGTGRKTVVNDLAYRMASEQVPRFLQDKRLIKLELAGILGSKVAPEQALLNIFTEAEHSGNIVFAVEDVHSLKKAVGGEGLSLLEILVNHLDNSPILVIATTTPEEYQNNLRTVTGFDEQFATYELADLDLHGILVACCMRASQLEASSGGSFAFSTDGVGGGIGSIFSSFLPSHWFKSKGGVFFEFQAIEEAVRLTDQYFKDKGQPEKAIEILKEAAQRAKGTPSNHLITPKLIQEIIAEKTHVPTDTFTENEADKLLNLEDEIGTRVIGQREAVVAVSEGLRRARSGLSTGQRPLASFLFVGPTGVGKTELARTLSKVYFGDERYLLRLDMSEYEGVDGMRKLLGISGSDATTPFITHLKTYPFSLFLLDELEKASGDVLNLFLQVLEDGRITTAGGQTLDLTHTIIIATSNAGTPEIQSGLREGKTLDEIRPMLMQQILTKYYRPEFLNRFDGVILFAPLQPQEVEQITRIQLKGLAAQLLTKKIKIQFTDNAIDKIAKDAFDPLLGGRPIRRYIQDHVESVIARMLLSKQLDRGGDVTLDVNEAGEFITK